MSSSQSGLAVAFVLGLALGSTAAGGLNLRPLGATSGLQAKVVPALAVDRNGFLWIGSREGLFRYDGYRAVRYSPDSEDPRSITDLDIRTVYEDPQGVIWVGTNTGGLNRFDAATDGFDHYRHDSTEPLSISHDSVYGMAADQQGDLWVGTQIGLNRLDRDTGRFTRYFHRPDDPASLSNDYCFDVLFDGDGAIWISTVGGGLNRWEPETDGFTRFDLASLTGGGEETNDVFGLVEDDSGTLWAGTRAGLVRIDRRRQRFSLQNLSAVGAEKPLIPALSRAGAGEIWVTTLTHGLARLVTASGEVTPVATDTLTPERQLMSIAATEEAVFVGTWGDGVFFGREPESVFQLLDTVSSRGTMRHDNLTAVMGTGEPGRPWAGTFGGGVQRVDVVAGVAAPLEGAPSELLTEGVLSLAPMPGGGLWAGGMGGLWELERDGRPIRFVENDPDRARSLGEGYVTSLLPTADGLWIGVGGSGLHHLGPGAEELTAYRHDPRSDSSLTGDYITSLLDEPGGRLWVGTRSNGLNLCRVSGWSCQRFGAEPGSARSLDHYHVTTLFRDSRDRVWVGTDGGGLHEVRRDAGGAVADFRRWGTSEGLISDSVMAIGEDDDGTLWVSQREGLSRLDLESGRVINYVAETGLPASHFNTNSAASDPRFLYFGTVSGLLAIPRGQSVPVQRPTPMRITAIDSPGIRQAARREPAWELSEHRLDYGETLSVEFAVLDFAESLHEYEYRLSPDAAWTRLGPRHEVTFFGLAPGHHTLEVRGRDLRGLWSAAPPLQLEVVPPLWMTTWFRASSALLLGLIAFGVPALRMRALERRNRELTRLKEQRERALALAQEREAELKLAYEGLSRLTRRLESAKEEERQHISRELHDELGQSLTAAKIQLQLLEKATGGDGVPSRLRETVAMLDDMIGQVRRISLGLRPPLLDDAGLVPALEHYLGALSQRAGVPIDLDAAVDFPACPPEVETTLFRVIQEAISNSLRHSGAGHLRVQLTTGTDVVSVAIEDDGRGFDSGEVRARARRGEHLGLLGMRERLRGVGGTIVIDSTPDSGTRIEARVPV